MKIKEYKIVWEDNYIIKEINFMEEFNKIDRLDNLYFCHGFQIYRIKDF